MGDEGTSTESSSSSESSSTGSEIETDGDEERDLLKTEERGKEERKEVSSTRDDEDKNKIGRLKERPYIHCMKDADTIRRLQGEVDRLNGVIRQQRNRRMKGKRNLKIEVTSRGRKIKEETDD